MADFATAYKAVLGNEGGYVNNPADPGGATMYGITERVAHKHGYAGDMHALPLALAYSIAQMEYWSPYHCDQMPQSVAFQFLDAVYNGGHPAQWLQQALHIPVTGTVDASTLAALECSEPGAVVARFMGYRLHYWTSLPTWSTFGKGWANRAADDLLKV